MHQWLFRIHLRNQQPSTVSTLKEPCHSKQQQESSMDLTAATVAKPPPRPLPTYHPFYRGTSNSSSNNQERLLVQAHLFSIPKIRQEMAQSSTTDATLHLRSATRDNQREEEDDNSVAMSDVVQGDGRRMDSVILLHAPCERIECRDSTNTKRGWGPLPYNNKGEDQNEAERQPPSDGNVNNAEDDATGVCCGTDMMNLLLLDTVLDWDLYHENTPFIPGDIYRFYQEVGIEFCSTNLSSI